MEYKVNKADSLIKSIIHSVQGVSFTVAQKKLRKGDIKVNGKRVKDNIRVEIGDIIDIYNPNPSKPHVDIVYEDTNILVVNKPQGLECATRDKSSSNTYSLEEILSEKGAIVVHRLDRLTEGLVILAKNKPTAVAFERIFRSHEVSKVYKALVNGKPKKTGRQIAYLFKDSKESLSTISDIQLDGYKEIITNITILETKDTRTLVDIELETGRTHQIRSHLSHLGSPIVNDSKYGKSLPNCTYKGYFLTAYKLSFNISDKDFAYLNELTFEISPTWLNLF